MGAGAFKWLRTGDEAFAEMLAAIEAARESVQFETYIFAACPLGVRFREALAGACRRGARVKVLIDAFGALSLAEGFWSPLREAGGEFRWFNPLDLKRLTFRDHRKLLVCDNRLAFVGGFNIAPEYEGNGVERGWRDLGLQVEGPLVEDLAASFDVMFARSDLQHRPFTRLRRSPARQLIASEAGQILLGGPGRGRNAIKRALLADLQQPRRVQIVSAYFLPTGRIRRALMRAARRGGLVQLILPAKTDVPLARSASHSFYQRLLRVGVEIYEYQPQILHTKLVIVDQTCYAGSANIDPRSLHINYDLMVRLTEAPLVAEARGIFDEHLRHCQRIDRRAWRASRTLWNKIKERWACFLLARLDQWLLRWQLRRLRL